MDDNFFEQAAAEPFVSRLRYHAQSPWVRSPL
jgi:hypothetical protein